MSDKIDGVDLAELERELKSVFNTAKSKSKETYADNGARAGFARAAAELAEAIVTVRQQRIAERDGGKVSKPLKVG